MGEMLRGLIAVGGDVNNNNSGKSDSHNQNKDENGRVEERALALPRNINNNAEERMTVLGRYNDWVAAYRERQRIVAE